MIFGQQRTRQQRGSGAGLRGIRIATGSRLVATSIGDLTGDGRSDVIASDPAKRNVVVYPGRRLGVVTPVASQWTFAGDAVIVEMLPAGDVDGDGRQDLLVRLDGSVTAAIVYGQPTLAAVNLAAPGSSATIIR